MCWLGKKAMSGDRKTPYKVGNRIGPDIAAVVAKHPRKCKVQYNGLWYKFMSCSNPSCKRSKGYWRAYTSSGESLWRKNALRNYCTDACASDNSRILRNERQARFRQNRSEAQKLQRQKYMRRWQAARRKRA